MEKNKFLTSVVVVILVLPYADATFSGTKVKKHFVLVHTVGHGAWSWYKIVALMRSSGYNVTAIDLGASGINPKQALEIPHFSDYLSPLMEFMASFPTNKKVARVGHSLGGLAISKAMEIFPEKISVAVFVTALMPGPTLNAATLYTQVPIFHNPNLSHEIICYTFSAVIGQLDNRVAYDNGLTNPPTTLILGLKYLATNIYQLSSNQDLALATTLVRPIYLYSVKDVSMEIVLSRKRYGSVRKVFIVAADDNLLKKEIQKRMIEKNPPDEVEVIQGSDHMTMMSTPLQLFTTLLNIANKYN
ncbi:salicylic acid-binding protein 2-like [Solanum tuberosum]|uniref:salicylic acid-binding protein 2-like n=1 Tax=Solanum tuberosum TaxID=4113 RepID=UPI00073A153C|nr:PREDICTED: salicylic acid-binding protein 2-like [Solanum tuberosum]